MKKKIAFWAKNRQKIGFFGVLRSTLRHLGISPYPSDDGKSHSIATHLDAQGAATIKQATLWRKKLRFGPKTVKKMGFFGVFRSTLRHLGISPYLSDDGKSHSIATHLDAQGVATTKQTTL